MNGQIDPWLNGAKTSLPTNSKSAKIAKAFFVLLFTLLFAAFGLFVRIFTSLMSSSTSHEEKDDDAIDDWEENRIQRQNYSIQQDYNNRHFHK